MALFALSSSCFLGHAQLSAHTGPPLRKSHRPVLHRWLTAAKRHQPIVIPSRRFVAGQSSEGQAAEAHHRARIVRDHFCRLARDADYARRTSASGSTTPILAGPDARSLDQADRRRVASMILLPRADRCLTGMLPNVCRSRIVASRECYPTLEAHHAPPHQPAGPIGTP